MSLKQWIRNLKPDQAEKDEFIEAEQQHPKIRFIPVSTIDKCNVDTVDIPIKLKSTTELSRHNSVTEKF